MKTKTIELFTFNELSKEGKEKALKENRSFNVDNDWYSHITEGFEEDLKELGYEDAEIHFNGFYSQGDGACFTAKLNIPTIIHRIKEASKYRNLLLSAERGECDGNITHSYRYFFASSTDVSIDCGQSMSEKVQDEACELESFIESEREVLGNKYYKILQDEYEARMSDEELTEFFEMNDHYTFTKDGVMDNVIL